MLVNFGISENDRFVAMTVPYHIYGLLFAVLVPLAASAGVNAGVSVYPDEIIAAISSTGRLDPEDGAAFFRQTRIGVTEVYGATETGGVATRNRALGETGLTPLASVKTRITGERLYVRSPYLSPNLATDAKGFFPDRRSRSSGRRRRFRAHGPGGRHCQSGRQAG